MSKPTLGVVANIYNESQALPGWLETATAFADDVRVFHAGPGGERSTDGTLEILEKWKIPVTFGSIDEGFGTVRTKTVRMSPCEWVMLLDADERFYPRLNVLTCEGESTPSQTIDDLLYDYGNPNFDKDGAKCREVHPSAQQVVQPYDKGIDFTACPSNFENMALLGANLRVKTGAVIDQGYLLRQLLERQDIDAIKTIRRHWHDFSWKRPTQNWHTSPDYQIRIVRNLPSIQWENETRMHERLTGAVNVHTPDHTHGPFFDHFHLLFKKLAVKNRQHAISIYGAIDRGEKPPSWEEYQAKKS